MLNKNKHRLVMTQILKDVYSDAALAPLLGFKGGTAAYFLYGLPRLSVDLDFDLLDDSEASRTLVFERVGTIIGNYGEMKDAQAKLWTIFFAVSYGAGEHQIKVEINTRKTGATYGLRNYLGLPLLVSTKESMFAAKLVALMGRKLFVARDLYDVYYFLKERWDIDPAVLLSYGFPSVPEYLSECVTFVEKVPDNELLAGLGELVDEEEKSFIRQKLKGETSFLLQAYMKAYEETRTRLH
jgi:predicted nucleotidyltransferase component of viral defense system